MPDRERREPSDDAVSPVVGMILVLGISIVGIAAILYWGLPAIDEMKSNVEHRSLESQFMEFDATVKELVAGTTEKTAKRWQPTLNRGSVNVVNESEAWLYSVILYNATAGANWSFVYYDLADGNNAFWILPVNDSVANAEVRAVRINGTTSVQPLYVSRSAGSPSQMSQQAWASGVPQDYYLFDEGGSAITINNATIRFQIYSGAAKIAEAWYVPTGRIDYTLEAGVTPKHVSQNNGAVITGAGDSYTLLNAPPIPPAANNSGTTRHFARAVVLNGTAGFAGTDRFDVLVTLLSTFTLGTYDCSAVLKTDCVEAVQVFSYGTYKDAWYAYLENTGRGYTFQPGPSDVSGVKYLYDIEYGGMGYTLLQSTVQLVGS